MTIKDNTTYVTHFLANNNQPIPVTIYTDLDKKAPKTCIVIREDIFLEIYHRDKEYLTDYVSELWKNIFQIHMGYIEFNYESVYKIEQQFIEHIKSTKDLKSEMKEI